MRIDKGPIIEHSEEGTERICIDAGTERCFEDRLSGWVLGRWRQRRAAFRETRCLPRTDLKGFHPVTTTVQRIAAMPNSRLRNCFHIDVFSSNLNRCIKW